MPNDFRTITNLSILALILVLGGRLMVDFGILDFWALFDIPTIPIWLTTLACFAIPALAYFGTLFTFAHQVSDYAELTRKDKVRELKSFQAISNTRFGPEETPAKLSWLLPTFDATSVYVRTNLSRHRPSEYFFAGLMLSCAYLLTGFFVSLPHSDDSVRALPSFAFAPFTKTDLLSREYLDSVRATITPVFWAFIGAYFYALQSLSLRVNARDATPGHFYSLVVRLFASIFLALLLHHIYFGIASDFGNSDKVARILPAAYFFCGIFPEAIQTRIWQLVKDLTKTPDRKPFRPALDIIDGIGEVHIERLEEIGIDSAYVLAVSDPFLTFVRLPYRLSQIVDWIGQSLLVLHFGESTAVNLRSKGIRNILDLAAYFGTDKDYRKQISELEQALYMMPGTLKIKWESISTTQPLIRLQELSQALAENERA
jgi:hypothetical protein